LTIRGRNPRRGEEPSVRPKAPSWRGGRRPEIQNNAVWSWWTYSWINERIQGRNPTTAQELGKDWRWKRTCQRSSGGEV